MPTPNHPPLPSHSFESSGLFMLSSKPYSHCVASQFSSKDNHTYGIINYTKSMYLQYLQLRDTVKYSWSQFFDFVFLKVPVIYFNNTKHSLNMQNIQDKQNNLRACKSSFWKQIDLNWYIHMHKRRKDIKRWGDHLFGNTLCPNATADGLSEKFQQLRNTEG